MLSRAVSPSGATQKLSKLGSNGNGIFPTIVPAPTAVSSTVRDFGKTALFLDLGIDNNGRSLITLKHKEHDGISRKFIHAYEVGMVNAYGAQGGEVSSGTDAFTIHLLSQIGIEFRLPNRSGFITATS